MNTNTVNLEYSEKQQCYHFNHWNDVKGDWDNMPNTNGYVSIGISDTNTLYRFCKLVQNRPGCYASLNQVKELWGEFKIKSGNHIHKLIK